MQNNEIKEILLKTDLWQHVRQKPNGIYEIRLTYKGVHYCGSGKDLERAKSKFLDNVLKLSAPQNPPPSDEKVAPANNLARFNVGEYAQHYLDVFKKPNICEKAYRNYSNEIKNHIKTYFKDKTVAEITATDCQILLNIIVAAGKGRLAEDIHNLLKWICAAAQADGLIRINPMTSVKILKHLRKAGKQIAVEVMRKYFSVPPKDRYDVCIMLIAYSGVRPCEIKTITVDGNFFTIKNAKRNRTDVDTFRRIPIHSALLPFIEEIKANLKINTDVLGQAFRRKFNKEYRLYDLRHTFTSRIQECGANKTWVDYVTAHVANANTTTKVYTHWSDEFQTEQMELLKY